MHSKLHSFVVFLTGLMLVVLLGSSVRAQSATLIKFPELAKMLNSQTDTTYLFNFWATWCQPCVTEFPDLQKFAAENAGRKFRLIFISLDFKKDLSTSVARFLASHNVHEQVYLLDEPDYNSWIDEVDSSWEGNLPASLVINNAAHVHKMFPQEFTGAALHEVIAPFIP